MIQATSRGPLSRWFKRDWPLALRALNRLMTDKQDTAQVFTIIRALAGRSVARGYDRLLNTPEGGRLAYERLELADRLMDPQWLSGFAEGTVGSAYATFMANEQMSARQILRLSRRGLDASRNDIPHPYAWFGRRIRDTHDIWHVLTGYGRDPLGEACLVAFSFAQTDGLGWAVIAIGSVLHVPLGNGQPLRRAVWEGYRQGRKAAWLLGEDYEGLLTQPLDTARTRLKIGRPAVYQSIPLKWRQTPVPGRRPRKRRP